MPKTVAHALVLHEREPKFGLEGFGTDVALNRYVPVVEVMTAGGATERVLDEVYRETNTVDFPWHPSAEVRSTSMGDVVVLLPAERKGPCSAHQVRMMGFEEVTLR
jgi:hypothetical protein